MKWLQRALMVAGLLLLAQIFFALTGAPRSLRQWLNAVDAAPKSPPRYIVVLGGGGIPSGSSLIRAYYAAEFGRGFTGAVYVVALPTDTNPETSSIGKLRDELVLRGVPANAIRMETRGRNTRQQAVNIAELLGPAALREPVVVVTSDYHLRRALQEFERAGFQDLAGLNAAGTGADADPGGWAFWRYAFWDRLRAQVSIVRELVAIGVGKATGWRPAAVPASAAEH
jgi:uncharacterized SAM-binding protein YcdF (DUF218 family)